MRKIMTISEVIIEENQMVLITDNDNLEEIIPKGQMLVDSDTFAFLYIVEDQNEYAYVKVHDKLWHQLVGGIEENKTVYLRNHHSNIELPNFTEEILYLIENIKENANYGDEMVLKVESVFL